MTLVLALVIVVLSVGLGIGISRFDFAERMPLIGALLQERSARTTTSPVVVEGVRELDHLATVRVTESIIVTRESGGDAPDPPRSGGGARPPGPPPGAYRSRASCPARAAATCSTVSSRARRSSWSPRVTSRPGS